MIRRKHITITLLFLFLEAIYPLFSYANTGESFLKLGVGARALGLASAYTAVANDVTSLYWNPAGLSHLTMKELSAMDAELFADTRLDFVGYAHPTSIGTFGLGSVYLSQGDLEGRADDRSQTGNFTASDLSITLGYGRDHIYQDLPLSLGTNLKVIQSNISGYSATGFALDLGSQYQIQGMPVSLGFALQNLGPQMNFLNQGYNLPLSLGTGVGYQLFKSFLISADLKYQPYDARTSFSIGSEFSPVSMLSLRAGYLTNAVQTAGATNNNFVEKLSNLSGLGMGVGLKIGSGTVDYSFTPAGGLGNTQRVSLSVRF